MSLSGSYDPTLESDGLPGELARLEAQLNLSWLEEARQLTGIGLRDGMTVLEIGCGPGFMAQQLLDLLPTSSLTALEVRPDLYAVARERLAAAGPRLQLVQGSVFDMDWADDTFDFAIARFLFQHLADPEAAARHIYRVLKPGGTLAIIDVDGALWGIVDPYHPGLAHIYTKANQLQVQHGGNRVIGRNLWRILAAAGYAAPRLEVFAYHSDALGLDAFHPQLDPARLLPAVQAGFVSFPEYLEMQLAYREFLTTEDAYILMLGFLAHGRKPGV